jgi:hypothetical protein
MASIRTGKRHAPPRLLLYGTEGIGKSTYAAQAPNPIFIPTEDGLGEIDCASFPLAKQLTDVEESLTALAKEPHEYQTVVIDSLDWLEQLIWDDLCRISNSASIEKVDGGYGKGYIAALGFWRHILDLLDVLHKQRNMAVILIAHAKVERFEDPESTAYDRYSPRLHKHASALLTEWVDAVLFATRKFRTETEDPGLAGSGRLPSASARRAASESFAPSAVHPVWPRIATTCPLNFPCLGKRLPMHYPINPYRIRSKNNG